MPLAHAVCFWFVLSTLRAQSPSASVAVSGVVQDQTGSVLPGATVDLVAPTGTVAQTTVTDGVGAFHFDGSLRGNTSFAPGLKASSPPWRSCASRTAHLPPSASSSISPR